MLLSVRLLYFSLILYLTATSVVESQNECPTNMFGIDNTFYKIYYSQATANYARNNCKNSGGRMVQIAINDSRTNILQYQLQQKINQNSAENISVFIGVQSNESHSSWLWNNGTIIVDDNNSFPAATNLTCQQVVWVLDRNMTSQTSSYQAINCSEESYYVCEFEFKPNVYSNMSCNNGSMLRVSWNTTLIEPKTEINRIVNLTVNSAFEYYDVEMGDWFERIYSGLDGGSEYTIEVLQQVSLSNLECENITVSASLTGITANGEPKSIGNPRTLPFPENNKYCILLWDHDPMADSYLINSKNEDRNYNETLRIPGRIHDQNFDPPRNIELLSFLVDAKSTLTIQSFSNGCGSKFVDVTNNCMAEASMSNFHSWLQFILTIVVPTAGGIILILLLTLIITQHKKKQKETSLDFLMKRVASTSSVCHYDIIKEEAKTSNQSAAKAGNSDKLGDLSSKPTVELTALKESAKNRKSMHHTGDENKADGEEKKDDIVIDDPDYVNVSQNSVHSIKHKETFPDFLMKRVSSTSSACHYDIIGAEAKTSNQSAAKAGDSDKLAINKPAVEMTALNKESAESNQLQSLVINNGDLHESQAQGKDASQSHYEIANKEAEVSSQESSCEHYANIDIFSKDRKSMHHTGNENKADRKERKDDVVSDDPDYVNVSKNPVYENLQM